MTFREFTGKNVEEAIRSAMAEFSADLSELDIEILAQGSRGVLGVGAEEARILAAPKSAVAAAESVRVETLPTAHEPEAAPREAQEAPSHEPEAHAPPEPGTPIEESAPVDLEVAAATAEEQVAELERADAARRTRGSRGRGGGRNGRERDREHAVREPRPDRPPREPRVDRPGREPAPFVSGKPVEELTEADWEYAWQTNVMSAVRASQAVLPGMRERGAGAIVNVASTSAKRPSTGMPEYSVTKAAMLSLSRLVADLYAKDGIRCNAVTPGPTATDAWLGRSVLELEQPFHPLGLGSGGEDDLDMSIFATTKPSYAEVLEARASRVALVRDFLAKVTPEELAESRKNPWAPQSPESTLQCIHVILEEEWEHHRYAVRDLDALEAS